MKRFLTTILVFIAIPLILLVGLYLWTDPFRCIHKFDIYDMDATNREYLSTELFLRNNPTYHYNSFIFASSRGMALNTYQWKQYLPKGSQPFLFQAWSETVTGIELKLDYMQEHHVPIDNALILIDIPGTFEKNQLSSGAMTTKHFVFTGESRAMYNFKQYFNFIQSPSLWIRYTKKAIRKEKEVFFSDTISNDFDNTNYLTYRECPPQDSLNYCSELTRSSFIAKVEHLRVKDVAISEPMITPQFEQQLLHIRAIFTENQTNYYIIISPAYCYTEPALNPYDLEVLNRIFGEERVHDYTGKNEWTIDYNNFLDPNHFGKCIGFRIIEDIYLNND